MKRDSMTMHALKADLKALKEADFVTSMNRLAEKEAARFLNLASLKNMPTKPKAPISFRIKRSARTKQFRCVVVAGNGEVILTGEPCKNRRDVDKMIENFLTRVHDFEYVRIDETKPAPKKPGSLNRNWP